MSHDLLRRLARRELGPRETAEALRHVGACEECTRDSLEMLGPQLDALRTALGEDEGPWHPDHNELSAYADGLAGAAEREIVESHLDDCPLCRDEVADLAQLRRPRPRRRFWRVAITAAAAAALAGIVIVQRTGDLPLPPRPAPVTGTSTVTNTATTASTDTSGTTATSTAPVLERLTAQYANAEWHRLVRTAVETRTLPVPRETEMTPDVLRGEGANPASRVSPSGVVLDETRPRFSWPERPGATYVVSVFAGEEQVAQSEPLGETAWTPPRPLPRGRSYVWQVQATRDGARDIIPAPPAPPAMFRIVGKREHDELASARRLHPDDHLLHAVLAARAGLREEALDALRRAGAAEARPLRDRYLD